MSETVYTLDSKIKIKSELYLQHVHDYDVDLLSNYIYLNPVGWNGEDDQGVDPNMANRFIKNMNLCRKVNPEKPIVIHMNTVGGDWDQGMAIYDTIKACPIKIIIINYACARSMSSIIMQAADKKVTMPNGTFMFHDGTLVFEGTVKQANTFVDWNRRSTDIMIGIYVESMRNASFLKNDSERKRWLKSRMDKKEDVFMTADEAIEAGFFHEKFNGDWKSLSV